MAAAHVRRRHPSFLLLQNCDDLLFAEPVALHFHPTPSRRTLLKISHISGEHVTLCASALLLGIALTGSSLPLETTASAAMPAMTPAAIAHANEQTRAILRARMAEQHIPALQVAVVVRGRVVMSEAYGVADIEQNVAASRETLFPINSATKSFTGEAIMQLFEAGKVDLDAPISRYLDDCPKSGAPSVSGNCLPIAPACPISSTKRA